MHRFVTDYAAGHPSEYFAESVKAFVKDESRPGVNRQTLQQNDPEMYAFVDNFFKQHVHKLV